MTSACAWPCSAEKFFIFVVQKRLRAFLNHFSPEGFAVSGVSAKFAGTPEVLPEELAKPSGFD